MMSIYKLIKVLGIAVNYSGINNLTAALALRPQLKIQIIYKHSQP